MVSRSSFSLPDPCIYPLPSVGCLHLSGPDRIAFLQRQTTNDVAALAPNRLVHTVLTSATARILDVLQLFEDGDTIGILPLPGRADATYSYLRRRIFFNDNVILTNSTPDYSILNLEGDSAGDWLLGQGIEPPPLDGVATGTLAEISVRVLGQPGVAGIGYRILSRAGEQLLNHPTISSLPTLLPDDYETLRVEAGLPSVGHELTEDYTPHETNLSAWISETKGCYTGQEILARQVTYDKITRHLVGLKLDIAVQPGANIFADGKSAGIVTSAVFSPHLGPIALAILKRPHHEPGTPVTAESEAGAVNAHVVSLPFPT